MTEAKFRLVVLDIDGTVLDGQGRVSELLKRTLRQLVQRDVNVVLCTGRRWRMTLPVLDELEHAHAMAVCCGGALIKDGRDHRTYHAAGLPRRTAERALTAMRRAGLVPIFLPDRPIDAPELLIAESDRERARSLPYIEANAEFVEYYRGDSPPACEEATIVYTMDDLDRVRPAENALRQELAGAGTVAAMRQGRYGPTQWALEAHHPSATKWSAVEWLLARWQIAAEQVVAIGDDVNDVPMLRAAGLSFAMGNAVPEARDAADRVTCTNDENGAAQALREVFALD